MEHVPEVAGIAQREPEHQVVAEQGDQDAVEQADAELRIPLPLGEGGGAVEHQRHLHRASARNPHQQLHPRALGQLEPEIGLPVADAAGREGQGVAGCHVFDPAVGIAQVDIDVVEQRVVQHQQPSLQFGVAVEDLGVEPIRTIAETESAAAIG